LNLDADVTGPSRLVVPITATCTTRQTSQMTPARHAVGTFWPPRCRMGGGGKITTAISTPHHCWRMPAILTIGVMLFNQSEDRRFCSLGRVSSRQTGLKLVTRERGISRGGQVGSASRPDYWTAFAFVLARRCVPSIWWIMSIHAAIRILEDTPERSAGVSCRAARGTAPATNHQFGEAAPDAIGTRFTATGILSRSCTRDLARSMAGRVLWR
jgi:hypothetical protein